MYVRVRMYAPFTEREGIYRGCAGGQEGNGGHPIPAHPNRLRIIPLPDPFPDSFTPGMIYARVQAQPSKLTHTPPSTYRSGNTFKSSPAHPYTPRIGHIVQIDNPQIDHPKIGHLDPKLPL